MSVSGRVRIGAVVPLFARRLPRVGPPWSNDELAQLYGVAQVLGRAGLAIDTENGVTDEGDPWFAFVRPDTDEVVAHFARIDGVIVGTGLSVAVPVKGDRLRDVVGQLLDQSRGKSFALRDETRSVILHPIVGLATFVAMGLLAVSEGRAEDTDVHEDRAGYLKAALDFVVDHIRSASVSVGSIRDDVRQTVTMASEDPRSAAAGNGDANGNKYFQVLVSVIAIALTVTGVEQGSDSELHLPSLERLISQVTTDVAETASEDAVTDQTATISASASLLAGERTDGHARLLEPLDVAFEDAAQDAPSAVSVESVEESGKTGILQARVAERPDSETLAVRQVTAGVDTLDPSFAVFQTETPAVPRAGEPAVAAAATPTPESTAIKATFLLSDLLEPAKAQTLVEGHSYVLLDFTSRIQLLEIHDSDASAPANSLMTVSLGSEAAVAVSEPTEAPSLVVPDAVTPVNQAPVMAPPLHKVLDFAAEDQMVSLSSAAETVLFNGGNLTIQNFQLGVDKLLVASPILDWSKATVSMTWEGDAVFRFDDDSSVTLIGVRDTLSA